MLNNNSKKELGKSKIPSNRISQLRSFFTETPVNKNNALLNIQSAIAENNKQVKDKLKRFVILYISKLNKYEINKLYYKLEKISIFLNWYENSLNKNILPESYEDIFVTNIDLYHMLAYPTDYPLKDLLYKFLYNFVLLPHYKNQNQFNQEVEWIILRLENFIRKMLNTNLYIVHTDIFTIENILVELLENEYISVSQNLKHHPFIYKYSFYCKLPNIWFESISKEHEISWNLLIKYSPYWLNIPTIISVLLNEKKLKIYNNTSFVLAEKETHILILELTENNNLTNKYNYRIQLSIKAIPNIRNDISSHDYLTEGISDIESNAEIIASLISLDSIKKLLLKYIYISESLSKQRYTKEAIEILDLIMKMFSKKGIEYNTIKKILNNSKMKTLEKIKKIKNIVLEYFNRQTAIKNETDIIDLNVKFNSLFHKITANNDYNSNYTEWKLIYSSTTDKNKILTKVEPTNLAPKLFLEKNTEKLINTIINYLKNRKTYTSRLINPPLWAIFLWPSWIGKTESMKYIANQTQIPIYTADISDILSMWLGKSEENIKKLFKEYYSALEKWPAILFIDEGDGFFWRRNSENNDLQNTIRSIVLQELQGFSSNENLKDKWFIVVATNFPENIDKALRERLWFFINFKLPSNEKRKEYLEYMLYDFYQKRNIKIENVNLDKLAKKTNWWSYRKLNRLLEIAIMEAIELEWDSISDNTTIKLNDKLLENAIKSATETKEEKILWFIY